jgi:hypothetical protein
MLGIPVLQACLTKPPRSARSMIRGACRTRLRRPYDHRIEMKLGEREIIVRGPNVFSGY